MSATQAGAGGRRVFLADGSGATVGTATNPLSVGLAADAAQGTLKSIAVTLSASAGTVTTITLPDSAQGVRLYPASNDIRFAIGEDPAAEATASGTTVAAAAFAVGAVAKADQWEVRLLGAGTGRTLRLRSAAASVVVQVGTF